MKITPALADPAPNKLGDRLSQVLAVLRRTGRPLTVGVVAQATGVHRNTARFHLDRLVEDNLAGRAAEPRSTPGRPRTLYTARPDTGGVRSFRLLAEVMTGVVATSVEDPAAVAVEAGRQWGRHLSESPPPHDVVGEDEAARRLKTLMTRMGFAPDIVETATGRDIHLHHCPFLELAVRHSNVVCAVHLGLLRGVLEEITAPLAAEQLEPFVQPSLCIARLRRHDDTRHGNARRRRNSPASAATAQGSSTHQERSRNPPPKAVADVDRDRTARRGPGEVVAQE
jgi:predicted ArsR family transcriptional regulator